MPLKPHPDAKPCSCGALIFFARTRTGGKMPLEAVPEMRGVLQGRDASDVQIVKTYRPHFATCPHAGQYRKKSEDE